MKRNARKPGTTDRERELEIIRILTFMSRDGWRYARPAEYLPLHRELKELQAQRLAGTTFGPHRIDFVNNRGE